MAEAIFLHKLDDFQKWIERHDWLLLWEYRTLEASMSRAYLSPSGRVLKIGCKREQEGKRAFWVITNWEV